MLFTVVDMLDVFCDDKKSYKAQYRSSNPYDYIRRGYYLDNGALFGGQNNVNFNCDYSSIATSNMLDITDK